MLPVWLTDTVTPDIGRAVHYTLLWGLEGVELRTVGSADDRVPQINVAQVREQLQKNDLLPAAVVPSMFEGPVSDRVAWLNDLATFDETLRLCDTLRCPRVVVSPFAHEPEADLEAAAEALRRAGTQAAEHDVIVAVLNTPESARPTGAALADLLTAVDHPNVQAAWNPAGALQMGEDPLDGLTALTGLVTMVRCSDGEAEGGYWNEQPLGDGAVDWPAQLDRLHAQGFRGPLSLEVYVEPRPKYGLRAATYLREELRKVTA
jgi:sugar phosphate isomerase/epimerase